MQTYSAKVRLAGSLYNEVPKSDLTAPEIAILKRIHGSDAIVDIKPGKSVDRTDEQERARLAHTYNRALAGIKNVGSIEGVLGPEGIPLAKTVSGVDSLPPPTTGKRAGGRPKQDDPVSPAAPSAPAEPIEAGEFS